MIRKVFSRRRQNHDMIEIRKSNTSNVKGNIRWRIKINTVRQTEKHINIRKMAITIHIEGIHALEPFNMVSETTLCCMPYTLHMCTAHQSGA